MIQVQQVGVFLMVGSMESGTTLVLVGLQTHMMIVKRVSYSTLVHLQPLGILLPVVAITMMLVSIKLVNMVTFGQLLQVMSIVYIAYT